MTQTVLFQHGLGGGEDQVSQNWPTDTSARRVTIPSQGHDDTPIGTASPFSIQMFAEDAIRALNPTTKIIAGGISMGAAIALYLACHHPEKVAALILVRPAWSFTPAPANMKPIAEIAELLKNHGPSAARTIFEASKTAQNLRNESQDNLTSMLSYLDRTNAVAFADVLHDIATGDPQVSETDVSLLKMPCLIIANDNDAIHPIRRAQELANTISNSDYIEVTPKALSKERHQSEIRAEISKFLSQISERQS